MMVDERMNGLLDLYISKWKAKSHDTYKMIYVQFDFSTNGNNVCIWSFDEYKIENITNNSASRLHKFRPKSPEIMEFDFESTFDFFEDLNVSIFYQIRLNDNEITKYSKFMRKEEICLY